MPKQPAFRLSPVLATALALFPVRSQFDTTTFRYLWPKGLTTRRFGALEAAGLVDRKVGEMGDIIYVRTSAGQAALRAWRKTI